MKAQQLNKEQAAALIGATAKNVLGLSAASTGRSGRGRGRSPLAADGAITEEMRVYFAKLKELVPFMPKNRKLSKLEIIQYVIDYICDLQLALEVHPAAASSGPAGSPSSSPPSSPPSLVNGSSGNRQPLGVIAVVPSNTHGGLSHTCAAQEANHDKLPSHLDEINTRPVSC